MSFLSNKKISLNIHTVNDGEMSVRSSTSVQSEGLIEKQQDRNSEIFFSFNNGYNLQENSEKNIQDKNNSLKKLKILEQELKFCKSKSNLWQKAKYQILNLNKFVKLSAISLNCSDSAILKQFFQSISEMLKEKDEQKNHQKSLISQAQKKQIGYFEKLVQSKKIRYELQQKIINYQHEISKLSDINQSLREKSRAQSTDVSSKIRQFHQESLMTIQQKELELTMMQASINQLKQQNSQLKEKIASIQKTLYKKQEDLIDAENISRQHKIERERLNQKILDFEEDEAKYQKSFQQIKEQLNKIIQENITIRVQLKKRGELVLMLRNIIQQAKTVNQSYLRQFEEHKIEEQAKRQQNLLKLKERQQLLKKNLKSHGKFGINRIGSKLKRLKSETKFNIISSEQLLI